MFKKIITILPKKLTIGLTFFVVFIFINIFFISYQAHGANIIEFKPQIPIPGGIQGQTPVGTRTADGNLQSDLLSKYLKSLYDYSLALASILAAVVMMGGGLLWLTSGGSEAKVGQAKDLIFGSVVGLGLVFSSWIILNTVNPNLLSLKMPNIEILQSNFIDFKFCHFTSGITTYNGRQDGITSIDNEIFDIKQEYKKIGEVCEGEKICVKPNQERQYSCKLVACCQAGFYSDSDNQLSWAAIIYADNLTDLRNECPTGYKHTRDISWIRGYSGSVFVSYHKAPAGLKLVNITGIDGLYKYGCINKNIHSLSVQ